MIASMARSIFLPPVLIAILLCSCSNPADTPSDEQLSLASPDGRIALRAYVNAEGRPMLEADWAGQTLLTPSALGFTFADGRPQLRSHQRIASISGPALFEQSYALPWGEADSLYSEATTGTIDFVSPENFQWSVDFRVMNDGMAYRTRFPAQPNADSLFIAEEHSQMNLAGDPTAWWIPGDWDSYEHLYHQTPLWSTDVKANWDSLAILCTTVKSNAVNTPVTLRWPDSDSARAGTHVAIHEAALYDYPGATFRIDTAQRVLETELVGGPHPWKAAVALPFATPWRTLTVAPDAAGLANSRMALHLNAPQTEDPTGNDWSWVKPMKYVGIWWEMHLDKAKWSRWHQDENGDAIIGDPHGLHGATTENTRRYLDFAAKHGFDGVLVEGWNTGWEKWIGFDDREGVFDFVTAYGDFDLVQIAEEARQKGLQLIAHHETSAAVTTYEHQMDTAYALMASLGQRAVKTGYVGPIIPRGEHHHGQWMVQHYQRTVERAAQYGISLNIHEPIKDTGIRRTWPNLMSREGARGQEFNAWGANGGNPPHHNPTLAFTRLLSGPMDFTPGAVHLSLDPYKPNNRVNTSLAHQLALSVVFHSPIQMACDLPEHYEAHPKALAFIKAVPCDWAWSEVIEGEVGEYIITARGEKGSQGRVFLGAINNGVLRELTITTDFLREHSSTNHTGRWLVETWSDIPTFTATGWALAVTRDTIDVEGEKINFAMLPGAGNARIFTPLRKDGE